MADARPEPDVRRRRIFAGNGTGKPCTVCGKRIESSDIEYELECANGEMLRVHIGCYTRSLQAGISGGATDPAWKLFDHRVDLTTCLDGVTLSTFLLACREARVVAANTRLRGAAVRARTRALVTTSGSRPRILAREATALATRHGNEHGLR